MIRVLFVRPSLSQGGADRVTRTLLQYLPRDRFAVSVALVQDVGEFRADLPGDIAVHVLGGRPFASAGALARVVKRARPDVLFSTSGGTNIPAVLAAEMLGHPCRVVLSERGRLFRGAHSAKRVLATGVKRVLYPFADVVTAVSRGVAEELRTELDLPDDRIEVVYNPIVTPEVGAGAEEPCAHPFFAPGGPPVVLAAGRLVREKDFDTLLRAFARVRHLRPVRLVILGEGPLRSALERLVGELGVGCDVALPGFDVNPFRYMARAAVFVLSSRNEGLPGALIQAMACGAPVISTDCPSGPTEIIERPGEDGLLVPVENEAALAAAMERVLADPILRRSLASAGRETAQRFELGASLERYIHAIEPSSVRSAVRPA